MQENIPQQENSMEKTSLELTGQQKEKLGILLNTELRKNWSDEMNEVFKQLAGRNHK